MYKNISWLYTLTLALCMYTYTHMLISKQNKLKKYHYCLWRLIIRNRLHKELKSIRLSPIHVITTTYS